MSSVYPKGLADYFATLPFLGHITSSHTRLVAGEEAELLLTYEVGAAALADGAWLKIAFKFYSDWGLFQTSDPAAANYISATYLPREPFPGESAATVRELKVRFDQKGHERPFQKAILIDVVDGYLAPGDRIEIRLGDRRFGGPGTRVQTFVEENFTFRAYVDTAGTSRFAPVPGDISMPILPGPAASASILTPRLVRPGVAVNATIRLEDLWGNLPGAPRGPARLSVRSAEGETVYEASLPWSDGEGWSRTQLALDAEGDYIVQANIDGIPEAIAPLTVWAEAPVDRALFADLHIHSEDTVGVNSTRRNLEFARDAAGLDVAGYTANDFQIETEAWQEAVEICHSLDHPHHFVCLPGTEWCGSSAAGGDRNVIFLGEQVNFPEAADGSSARAFEWNEHTSSQQEQRPLRWPASELHAAYRGQEEEMLLIPHVGGRRSLHDWHDPGLERLVEVASSWGHFDWFYRDALRRGHKVGASAAGDEHRGRPGGGAPGVGSFGVRGGITGILTDSLTRPVIGRALRARHTWATTGSRAVALLATDKHRQGDTVRTTAETTVRYDLFGNAGWEFIEIRDGDTVLARRSLDEELGLSPQRFRIRWGGARIPDRYRWAEWRGTVTVEGARVAGWQARGLEHPEETVREMHAGEFAIATDTYGDADHLEIEVDRLEDLNLTIDFQIGAYHKTGDPLKPRIDPRAPGFRKSLTGSQLIRQEENRFDLDGQGLFVSIERVSEATLPRRVSGSIAISSPREGHRAIHLFARERDDSKVWTSPLFFENPEAPKP